MADQEKKDPPQCEEDDVIYPYFYKKQTLNEKMKMEMMKEADSLSEIVADAKEMWKSTLNALTERKDIEISLMENHKSHVYTATPDKPRRLRNNTALQAAKPLSESDTQDLYEMWCKELEKNAEMQRAMTRQMVKGWFDYLHKFDDKESVSVDSPPFELPFTNPLSWSNTLVIILCGLHVLLFYGPEEENSECGREPLNCFKEKIIDIVKEMYSSYLAFHNLTIDYTDEVDSFFHNYSNLSNLNT